MPKFLTSSVDPEKISLTVKGVIVAIVPIVITIAGLTHLNLGQADITALGDGLINLVNLIAQLTAAIMVVWGIARKIGVGLGLINPVQK